MSNFNIEKCDYLTTEEERNINAKFKEKYIKLIKNEIKFKDAVKDDEELYDFCVYICKSNNLNNGEEILFSALTFYLYKYRPIEEQDLKSIMKLLRAMNEGQNRLNNLDFKSPTDRIFDEVEKRDPASMALKFYIDFKTLSFRNQEDIISNLIKTFYFVDMIVTKEDLEEKIQNLNIKLDKFDEIKKELEETKLKLVQEHIEKYDIEKELRKSKEEIKKIKSENIFKKIDSTTNKDESKLLKENKEKSKIKLKEKVDNNFVEDFMPVFEIEDELDEFNIIPNDELKPSKKKLKEKSLEETNILNNEFEIVDNENKIDINSAIQPRNI